MSLSSNIACVNEVVRYIVYRYDDSGNDVRVISGSLLTNLLFLSDWKFALEYGNVISGIKWKHTFYPGYIHEDIIQALQIDDDIEMKWLRSGMMVNMRPICTTLQLYKSGEIIDFIIEKRHRLGNDGFMRLFFSVYPLMSRSRYTELDLVQIAAEYKNLDGGLGIVNVCNKCRD
ncbi:MAG: hypothetical protein LBP59_10855 [Planctomycetaceae bacterium]|nr:hypothetical protein [Planctomycetaceae bacterium]